MLHLTDDWPMPHVGFAVVYPDRAFFHAALRAEADVDDAAAAAGGDAAMDDALAADMAAAPADEVASDDSGTATEEDATRPVLEPGVRDATAEIIVRLAGSALSSKVGPTTGLWRQLCHKSHLHRLTHRCFHHSCSRFSCS
jgi:hypothetical protein